MHAGPERGRGGSAVSGPPGSGTASTGATTPHTGLCAHRFVSFPLTSHLDTSLLSAVSWCHCGPRGPWPKRVCWREKQPQVFKASAESREDVPDPTKQRPRKMRHASGVCHVHEAKPAL